MLIRASHALVVAAPLLAMIGCGGRSPTTRTAADEQLAECDGEVPSYRQSAVAAAPLEMRLESGGALVHAGVSRTRAASDALYLSRILDSFQPTVVYYDGADQPARATAEESLAALGAASLASYIATRDGVRAISVEPTTLEQVTHLRHEYPADQVKLFFVLREVARLNDVEHLGLGELLEASAHALVRANDLPGLTGEVRDLSELENTFVAYYGASTHWTEVPASWFDPSGEPLATGGRFITSMSASLSHYRDVVAYRRVATAALDGERVLALVDDHRAPVQAPALVCALEGR